MKPGHPPRRIALIHATRLAMAPIETAFAAQWPQAERVHLLDDSLAPDRARDTELTETMTARIVALAQYAVLADSHAVLFTCSAFGTAIEHAATTLALPVLKPNEAMFEAALQQGNRIAMLYTFAPAKESMEAEFRQTAARLNPQASLNSFLAEGAVAAANASDLDRHNRLLAQTAAGLKDFDAIMLAHFSTSSAAAAVRAVTAIPVLTSPDAAVRKLQSLVG